MYSDNVSTNCSMSILTNIYHGFISHHQINIYLLSIYSFIEHDKYLNILVIQISNSRNLPLYHSNFIKNIILLILNKSYITICIYSAANTTGGSH